MNIDVSEVKKFLNSINTGDLMLYRQALRNREIDVEIAEREYIKAQNIAESDNSQAAKDKAFSCKKNLDAAKEVLEDFIIDNMSMADMQEDVEKLENLLNRYNEVLDEKIVAAKRNSRAQKILKEIEVIYNRLSNGNITKSEVSEVKSEEPKDEDVKIYTKDESKKEETKEEAKPVLEKQEAEPIIEKQETDTSSISEPVKNDDSKIQDLANKMTIEEMNYILELEKIANKFNLSLNQMKDLLSSVAGLVKNDVKTDNVVTDKKDNTEEKESNIEETKEEKPVEEKSSVDTNDSPSETSTLVKSKSLDKTGEPIKYLSDGQVQVESEDGIFQVPIDDLENVKGNTSVNKESQVNNNPEDVSKKDEAVVSNSNYIQDSMRNVSSFNDKVNVVKTPNIVNVSNGRRKVKKIKSAWEKLKNLVGINSKKAVREVVKTIEIGPKMYENGYKQSSATQDDASMMANGNVINSGSDTPEQIASDLNGNLNDRINMGK